MKKLIALILVSFASASFMPCIFAGRGSGGAAAAGVLGGLAVGTMIGSAASRNSQSDARADRAEQEAIRAQDKADQIRMEQDRQRVAQLEREIDRGSSHSTMMMALAALAMLLFFAVIGMTVLLMRKK